MIKPAYSVSFLLSINIFVWQNVLYFPNDLRMTIRPVGAEMFHEQGQKRRDAANSRFLQFCKARKKETFGLLFRVVTPSTHLSVSQPPGPGINYTGPREA